MARTRIFAPNDRTGLSRAEPVPRPTTCQCQWGRRRVAEGCPPRRFGRAQFGHPALRAEVSLRANARPRDRHFRRLSATCTSVETRVRNRGRVVFPHGSHNPVRRFPLPDPCGRVSPTSPVLSADSDLSQASVPRPPVKTTRPPGFLGEPCRVPALGPRRNRTRQTVSTRRWCLPPS